jgi:hypothetical protein
MNSQSKNKILRGAGLALLMVAGGAAGYWGASTGMKAAAELPGIAVAAIAVLFIPACLLVIGFHEAGHAVAGLAMNFDFRMYVVGPLLWDKEEKGWRFKWNKNVNTFGGFVICIPSPSPDLNKRFAFYAAGGPLASFVLAALAYGAHLLFSTLLQPGVGSAIAINLLYILSVISAIIGFITLVPLHSGGFSSDGARMLRLWRGGEEARFETMLLTIISASMAGTRPAHYNLNELEEAQALAVKTEAPMGVYIQYYLYYHAFDSGDVERAEHHLDRYLEQIESIPEGVRGGVWMDAALFHALVKKDVARAIEYRQRYKPSALIPKAMVHAVDASIASLQGDRAKASALAQQALDEIPNMIDRGIVFFCVKSWRPSPC